MGRAVIIFKVDKNKSKKGLFHLISDGSGMVPTFEAFTIRRKNDFGAGYKVRFSHVQEIAHNDIDQITPALLFEITYWLSETIGMNSPDLYNLLSDQTEISCIYESSTKSEANALITAYYEFLEFEKNDIPTYQKYDDGAKWTSLEFKAFLDHFLLLLHKINTNILNKGDYDLPLDFDKTIDKIIDSRNADQLFMEYVNQRFKTIQLFFMEEKENQGHENLKNLPELELITRNSELIHIALRIKEQLTNDQSIIIIVDAQ